MNSRDVFKVCFRAARLAASHGPGDLLAELEMDGLREGLLQAGLADFPTFNFVCHAHNALRSRDGAGRYEPSRNSVRIQLLLFAHGRVRRSA